MKKKKYLAIFMAMSMATATAPVTALADEGTGATGTESGTEAGGENAGGENAGGENAGGSEDNNGGNTGESGTTTPDEETGAAKIGEIAYETLAEAIEAAKDGDTVTLVNGVELSENVTVNADITLDLNGKKISTNGHAILVNKELVVTGKGEMENTEAATKTDNVEDVKTMIYVAEDGKLTVENGTFKTAGAQAVYTAGEATVQGGTFTCTATSVSNVLDGKALLAAQGNNAQLTFLDGELNAKVNEGDNFIYGIYPSHGATIVIGDETDGPTINAASAVALNNLESDPSITITVNNGTFNVGNDTLSDTYSKFNTVFYLSGSCDVTINGGTFKTTNAKTHIFSFPYYKTAANLKIKDGIFDASNGANVFYSIKSGDFRKDANSISVEGGKFQYTTFADFNSANTFEKFVSGGVFDSDVQAYATDNYKAIKTTGGKYAVAKEISLDGVKRIRRGNTTTLKAIVKANGETYDVAGKVTWATGDATVATVDANGIVTGVAVGSATITATVDQSQPATQAEGEATDDSATTPSSTLTASCTVDVFKRSSGSSSGGGGGSTSTATNKTTISDSKNGEVTASSAKADTGDKVVLTPKADEGYVLDKITVKDKDGKEVALKAEKDGTYSFTMPKGGVTVDTTFKLADGTENTDKPAAEDTKTIVLQIGSTAVIVDDQAIINDVAPVIRNDRTLVPIRVITEALGGQVAWNEAAKEVTLTINGKEIKMTIGKTLEKYGVAPVIIGDRTFVPVRFVADELGAVTTWDDATKTVTIKAVK